MTDFDKLRGSIYSTKGGWTVGGGIATHGHSLLDDIFAKCSVFQVMIMNVTGKLPERRLADLVEGVFICMSWPDSRIWCNKIGTFTAMTRASATTAIAAGGLGGDSTMYGAGTGYAINSFIESAYQKCVSPNNDSVETFVKENAYRGGRLYAPGFARPFVKGDERIPAMRRYAKKLGFEVGPYETLANEIESILSKRDGEGLNLAGYIMLFLKDQGYSIEEVMGIGAMSVTTGIYASYFEYINRPPEAFLSLKVEDIDYVGETMREVPEKPV